LTIESRPHKIMKPHINHARRVVSFELKTSAIHVDHKARPLAIQADTGWKVEATGDGFYRAEVFGVSTVHCYVVGFSVITDVKQRSGMLVLRWF
jgi:hypothetical protein